MNKKVLTDITGKVVFCMRLHSKRIQLCIGIEIPELLDLHKKVSRLYRLSCHIPRLVPSVAADFSHIVVV